MEKHKTKPRTYLLEFPIYTIDSRIIKDDHIILVAGGGGKSKTGIPNAFQLFKFKDNKPDELEELWKENTGDRIIYSGAFHPTEYLFAVSKLNFCSIYSFDFSEDTKKITKIEELYSFRTDFNSDESVQRVCAFSPSGKYFTTGGEDGKVRVWEIKKKGSPTQISEINFDPDINCISYSTDSQLVLLTAKNRSLIHEIDSKKEIKRLDATNKYYFRGSTFLAEDSSRFLIFQGKFKNSSLFTVFNIEGKLLRKFTPSLKDYHTAFSSYYNPSNSRHLLAGAHGDGDLEVSVMSKNGIIRSLHKSKSVHSHIITTLSITKDSKYVISGCAGRYIIINPVRYSEDNRFSVVCFFILFPFLMVLLIISWILGFVPALEILSSM